MKRISLLIAATAIVGFAGVASAHHKDGHENSSANSAKDCFGSANPGQTFQVLGLAGPDSDSNPGQAAKAFPENWGQTLKEICEVNPD